MRSVLLTIEHGGRLEGSRLPKAIPASAIATRENHSPERDADMIPVRRR